MHLMFKINFPSQDNEWISQHSDLYEISLVKAALWKPSVVQILKYRRFKSSPSAVYKINAPDRMGAKRLV